MDDQIQTKDTKNQDSKEIVEEIEGKKSPKPKSDAPQKVTKERIERFKRAFRPTWLIRQLDFQENKKGK